MKNLSKISDEKDIATKEYVDPVALDTTKTYTYAYFKSLENANRRVKIDEHNIISRMAVNEVDSHFDYVNDPDQTGYYVYHHTSNQWEHNETPLVTLNGLVEKFDAFVPTKISNQNNDAISIWTGTQAEYDAIMTKDAYTLYFIVEQ